MGEYMGTTALTESQRVATSTMKFFIVLCTASLATCAPTATLLHPAAAAVVPVGTHQWPGITDGPVDITCFGCRPLALATVGRKRRGAEPEAKPEADPFVYGTALLGHPFLPFHAPALVGSYTSVDSNGAQYKTGTEAVHPVVIPGRQKREAEDEVAAQTADEAAMILAPVKPLFALNGYAHDLQSGRSFASISTPNIYQALHYALPPYPFFG